MSVVERIIPPADLLERIREKEKELESLRAGLAAWEGALERAGQRDVSFTSISGAEVEPLYTPLDRPVAAPEEAAYYNERIGMPGEFPFTRGTVRHHVPHAAVDHAPVRRLRHGGGDQRALPLPAGPRPDGPVRRVRLSHADGVRQRPPAVAGRGGQVRRGHLVPGRHGDPVPRHPAGPGLRQHDHQRPRDHPLLLLHDRGGKAGRAVQQAARHGAERHPQGVPGAARLGVSAGARPAAHRGHVRVGVEGTRPSTTPSPSAATTSARRGPRPCRSWRTRSRTGWSTCGGAWSGGWTWTTSRRASRSSGTCTTTSSRRSPSSAPPAASGRATCATTSGRRTRKAGAFARTRRRPA